jgi:hypothetical protein
MLFFANRANLDRRQVLTRLHVLLGTQVTAGSGPVEQVWYHTSAGNKVGVRATIDTASFLDVSYPVEEGELQVTFDFPPDREYDHYRIQWVEREQELMVGWHQGDAHEAVGPCHFQVDYRSETVQRVEARFIDAHPLNVFDERTDQLVEILDSLVWEDARPSVPEETL